MNKFVALMHRYCHDYTNRQDFAACDEVIVPGYVLHMGRYDLVGRDAQYKPATQKQFDQFPGLCLTINAIVTNGERLLLRFSEHGASIKHGGAQAAWGGIGLYKWDGERLTENFVEQDYYARREQLASRRPHVVESPAIAPWDTLPQAPNPDNEASVRTFVEAGGDLHEIPGIVFDDEGSGAAKQRVITPLCARVDDLFSAGDQVAFRLTQTGRLLPDFAHGKAALQGRESLLYQTAVVTVRDGRIVAGRVIRDRLGLYRELMA